MNTYVNTPVIKAILAKLQSANTYTLGIVVHLTIAVRAELEDLTKILVEYLSWYFSNSFP